MSALRATFLSRVKKARRAIQELTFARAVVAVAVAAFAWIVYENLSSKDVWSAVQTLVIVIAGTYLAIGVRRRTLKGFVTPGLTMIGAVVLTLAFTPGVEKAQSIGTSFLLESETGKPASIRLMRFQPEVATIIHALPDDAWKAKEGPALIYHHLLQRAILQYLVRQQSRRAGKMTMFLCGWDPEIWQDKGVSTTIIGADEIKRTFASNRFISAQFIPAAELVVPKGTKLIGVVPGTEADRAQGVIKFKNPYFELKIQTSFSSSLRGIQGDYARLTTGGRAKKDDSYSLVWYGIDVSGKSLPLNRLFPYHPNTATYIDWTQQIAKNLTCIFEERERWKFMVDQLNFRHLVGATE